MKKKAIKLAMFLAILGVGLIFKASPAQAKDCWIAWRYAVDENALGSTIYETGVACDNGNTRVYRGVWDDWARYGSYYYW